MSFIFSSSDMHLDTEVEMRHEPHLEVPEQQSINYCPA